MNVDDAGFTTFEPDPKGRDRSLVLDDDQISRVIATQRALASQPPRN